MLDNRAYSRLVEEAVKLKQEIDLLEKTEIPIDIIKMDKHKELTKTEESISEERRKMRGQVHFLLDLIASDEKLIAKLKAIIASDC